MNNMYYKYYENIKSIWIQIGFGLKKQPNCPLTLSQTCKLILHKWFFINRIKFELNANYDNYFNQILQ